MPGKSGKVIVRRGRSGKLEPQNRCRKDRRGKMGRKEGKSSKAYQKQAKYRIILTQTTTRSRDKEQQ